MRKFLIFLVALGLMLTLGTTSTLAGTISTEENTDLIVHGKVVADEFVTTQTPSLKIESTDVKTTIEENPADIVDYFDFGVDFFSTVLAKLAKTAKPAYLLNGQVALEVSVYERPNFDVIWGFCKDGAQYYGVEINEIPLTGVLPEIFKKIRPQVVYYTGNGGYFTVGICYEFRENNG